MQIIDVDNVGYFLLSSFLFAFKVCKFGLWVCYIASSMQPKGSYLLYNLF